jgi:hypothetical protein
MALYPLEQLLSLHNIYVKYDLLEIVGEDFDGMFVMKGSQRTNNWQFDE